MLVWQSSGEAKADTDHRVHSEWRIGVIPPEGGWQISRQMRVALEYALAIGCALGMSWLILRLGL
jgi:hypothetical protein